MIGGMHQGLSCSKSMLVFSSLALVDHRTLFALAPLEFLISAPRGLSYMQNMGTIKKCNKCGAKCNMMHETGVT
jgi:hypothetical protein